MLDALILKHLTKKGVIAYFVGQILLFGVLAFYIFGVKGSSMNEGEMPFIVGMVIIALIWAGICLLLWKKPKESGKIETAQTKS
ncbi:hypothetical protein ACFFU1_04890 [Algibacter miyuki]|uniref:Uncharacterized protein n=1 Tax=Algibacter miyuki TaxID=1306933 RepID=A0ABV5GX36_9FLAO|nr:hypothetical protein [Algibacter miyuki]MDN3666077.1 hypothetical protein [Algibacter miyuki]